MHITPIVAPLAAVLLLVATTVPCVARLRSARHASAQRWRRVLEWLLLAPPGVLAVVLALSCIANAVLHRYYAAHVPVPGKLYVVDGSVFHLYCTGAGSPTVILEAGLGSGALSWGAVQPELSKLTRVCSYDRAGLGWSAPRAGVRDADHAVRELAALLEQAGVGGPLVLVGHSLGGLYVRLYASRHPEQVAGLVLVDSAVPANEEVDSAALRAYLARRDSDSAALRLLARAVLVLGVPRLTGDCSEVPKGFAQDAGRARAEDLCDPDLDAVFGEEDALAASRAELVGVAVRKDLPLLVISQDTAYSAASEVPPELVADWARNWDRRQEALQALSTRSRRVVAEHSGHFILFDRPDVIDAEVGILIGQLRGGVAG